MADDIRFHVQLEPSFDGGSGLELALRLIAARSADDGRGMFAEEMGRFYEDAFSDLVREGFDPDVLRRVGEKTGALITALVTIAWALPIAAQQFERLREEEGANASDMPMTAERLLDLIEKVMERQPREEPGD